MTQINLRYLDKVLAPQHALLVDNRTDRTRLTAAVGQVTGADQLSGYISCSGRVLGCKLPTGQRVLYEGDIVVDPTGEWEPAGEARLYSVDTDDDNEVDTDVRRLFLAQSLRNGAFERLAGWRDRIVAFIPEEVGPKESTIMRTLADGQVEARHTYNVLDAVGTYAGWVHDLAMEFGSTDYAIALKPESSPEKGDLYAINNIVQPWLMREAAEAELEQARLTLKLGLALHDRLLRMSDEPPISMAELARSLYTDRPNLTRVVKAAEGDRRVSGTLGVLDKAQ